MANPQIPALHLYPLNDSFVPKQISLAQGKVRIGRQTNARTVPGERNGYFDSKVLSRMHAEVWEENGKILIKDVKSSNGTFINSERLSPEGVESEPFELKSEDIVEFGIDIVGEDNRTIVHHKVAAKVYCILTPEDLLASQMAAREMQYMRNPSNRLPHPVINGASPGQGVNGNGAGANGVPGGAGGAGGGQQQPQPGQPQGQAGQPQTLGGMGATRAPGKSGLTFDHLLSRLQGEIVKSRETGNELGMIGREIGEIGETLSGGLPQQPPPPPPHPGQLQREPSSSPSNAMLSTLQSQLHETRASLASHADKVRTLESLLAEHDALKREVAGMREAMEESRRLLEVWRHERERDDSGSSRSGAESEEDDMDDRKSILTITPDDLDGERDHERGQEQEHESVPQTESEQEREHRENEEGHGQEGMHRPKTPEPTGHGLDDDEPAHPHQLPSGPHVNGIVSHGTDDDVPPITSTTLPPLPPSPPTSAQQPDSTGAAGAAGTASTADYITRSEHAGHLNTLQSQISDMSLQLASALQLSKELSAQQEIIRQLEERLAGYEAWKQAVDERVGGISERVEVVETWRKEREEERKRDEEWEAEERDQILSLREEAGERSPGSGSEEEGAAAPAQAPRPRRRRKSKSSRPNGSSHAHVVGASRSSAAHHGSSSPSSSSSETRSSAAAIPGRRLITKAGRVRSESASTANGSEYHPGGLKERDGSEGDTLVESLPDIDEAGENSLAESPVSATFPGGSPDSKAPGHEHTDGLKRAALARTGGNAGGAKDLSGTGAVGNILVPVAVVVVAGIAAWAVVNRAARE